MTPLPTPPFSPAIPVPPLSAVKRRITQLVIHCAATPSGQWLSGTGPAGLLSPAQVIDGWHHQRGFGRSPQAMGRFNGKLRAIGYHYVIDLDGHAWTGRHLDEIGAHAVGHNAESVGICLVGGAEPQGRYTTEQWVMLGALVHQLVLGLSVDASAILGHRDLSPDTNGDGKITSAEWLKTCPGFDVRDWIVGGLLPLQQHVAPSV